MPLVRISVSQGKSSARRQAMADAVHRALVDCIGIPPGDRFQIVAEHADAFADPHYLGIQRSGDVVFVHITLVHGRPQEKKLGLYAAIARNLTESCGVRPEDVVITLVENERVDWSVGNGEAQLVDANPQNENGTTRRPGGGEPSA